MIHFGTRSDIFDICLIKTQKRIYFSYRICMFFLGWYTTQVGGLYSFISPLKESAMFVFLLLVKRSCGHNAYIFNVTFKKK